MAWIASHLGPRAAAVGLLLGGCTVADGDLPGTWEGTAKFDDGTKLEVRVEVHAEEHPFHVAHFDPESPWRNHAVTYEIEGRASAEGLLSVCDGPQRCRWDEGGGFPDLPPNADTVGPGEVILLGMVPEEDRPCWNDYDGMLGLFQTTFEGEFTGPRTMEGLLDAGPDSCQRLDTNAPLKLKRVEP